MESSFQEKETQVAFEQHEFELRGSTYMQIFFNKYIGKYFEDLWQFEKNLQVKHIA